VTDNLDCKVTTFFHVKYLGNGTSQEIAVYLQWQTDRKSYMIYRTVPFSMTLNVP